MQEGTSLMDLAEEPVDDGELEQEEEASSEEEETQAESEEEEVDEIDDRIAKLEKRVKDNQTAYRKESQEKAILKAQLQAYREAQATQQSQPTEDQWVETLKSIEEADEPGVEAYRRSMESLQTVYDEVTRLRQELKNEISASVSSVSPEKLALQDVYDELADAEWFQSLPPAAQLQAAKTIKGKNGASRKTPPGGEPSGRKVVRKSKKKEPKTLLPPNYRINLGLTDDGEERKNTLLG